MKLLISDYPNTLHRDLEYEIHRLKQALPDAEIFIHPYHTKAEFISALQGVNGLLTAFLPIDEEILSSCTSLKYISINATGYNSIDLESAKKHNVTVCAIQEYCTQEVAEFTMSLILSLSKNIKKYQYRIEKEQLWEYQLEVPSLRLAQKTLAIFGFGRIGQTVAKLAQAFGMKVLAVDPYRTPQMAADLWVELVSPQYATQHADIISNHLIATKETEDYFNTEFFSNCLKKPYFINVGRGVSVDESALFHALQTNLLSGAGMDVLKDATQNSSSNPFVGLDNVILTPHAAFYSADSMKALQDISCDNLIHCINGNMDNVHSVVI